MFIFCLSYAFVMSTDESLRVREALDVLCNASGELLKSHGTEFLAAIQKLHSRIEGYGTAIVGGAPYPTTDDRKSTHSSVSHRTPLNRLDSNGSIPSTLDGESSSALLRDQHASPLPPLSPVEDFMRGLKSALNHIETFLSQECRELITSEPVWKTEDPRIVDIQVAQNSKPSEIEKFRRGLSQRSLAIEFDSWENKIYGVSSIEKRAENPSVQLGRKLGRITKFLDANTHRFHNHTAARGGIEHGIKLLVCEKLLGGKGISAIFIFRFTSLRRLKYEELNALKDAIEEQGSKSIMKLARQKTDWLGRCQSIYNGK